MAAAGAMFNDAGGPWGGRGSGGGNGGGGGDGGRPPSPWSRPPEGGRPRGPRGGGPGPSAVDQIVAKLREIFGGGNFRGSGGRSYWPWVALAFVILWVLLTSVHRVGPEEAGIVTRFGKYSSTLQPGVTLTLPAPIDRVELLDVQKIDTITVGSTTGGQDNLVLTGDQNVVDLAYSVRWRIKPGAAEQFLFQIADREQTITEVAESAMRAVLANFTLIQAIGPARTDIEQQVALAMQRILDDYRSGVEIQGVAISQADPPSQVNDAFKQVAAAQQQVESNLNDARAYAQQVTARAQGEAGQFDKVYEQYSLAPEVTRRRMYYETMEKVLSRVDKTVVESNGVTPYLPLPELRRRAAEAPAP